MYRKALFAVALSAAVSLLVASGASALDCVNVSRPPPSQPAQPVFTAPDGTTIWVVTGDWWFLSPDGSFSDGAWDKIPPGTAASILGLTADQAASIGLPPATINGNYQGGSGIGLLDNAQAPCVANRQTGHGIQADSSRCLTP